MTEDSTDNSNADSAAPDDNNNIYFACVGDVHGQFSTWIRQVENWETKHLSSSKERLSFVLQVGDIETHRDKEDIATMAAPASKRDNIGDFGLSLYNKTLSLKWPTYFIGGNHECYGYLDGQLERRYEPGSR